MKAPGKTVKQQCFHCGESCDSSIESDDKVFCCFGCKTVYELLRDHKMGLYYELGERPGIKSKSGGGNYAYLDEPQVLEVFTEFEEGNLRIVTLSLPAIHCSSCIWLLENLPKLQSGVRHVKVDFNKRTARIHYNQNLLKLSDLAHLLDKIGYAPDFSLDAGDGRNHKHDRSLTYKVGIAGFAFGNAMLMALPEYLDLHDLQLQSFLPFFRLLIMGLSIPVVVYAGKDYFVSSYKSLRSGFFNLDVPIALGISALFLRSSYEVLSGVGPGYFDSLNGLIFFLLLGKIFQRRTYEALRFDRDYTSFFPLFVNLIEDDVERAVPAKGLKAGNQIRVRNGELIPADAILLKGKGAIDNSFATGEAMPVNKLPGDKVYAGGRQRGGAIDLEVLRPMEQSKLTRLWNDPMHLKQEGEHFKNLTDRISRNFTFVVLTVSVLGAAYWYRTQADMVWTVVTSVLIIACPCALALSAPFALGNVLRIFGRNRLFLKNTDVVENLAECNVLVLDKTGTLTESWNNEIQFSGILTAQIEADLRALTYHSGHPVSRAIYKSLGAGPQSELRGFKEFEGEGVEAIIGEQLYRLGKSEFVGARLDLESPEAAVHLGVNGVYKGYFILKSRFREGLNLMHTGIKSLNWQTFILSGDTERDSEPLKRLMGNDLSMHFRQNPEDKLEFIKHLQNQGARCAMVGDGLNDAGALRQSMVGIGISEEPGAFTPASDAILHGQNLSQLPKFVQMAKWGVRVVWLSFGFSFFYNSIGMYFALSGQLSPVISAILMPLSSISVVVFVTLMTNWKAKQMGL